MTTRSSLVRAVASCLTLCAGTIVAAGVGHAFSEQKLQESGLIAPQEIPSVHNTFYQVPEGVIGWDTLGNLDITTEVIAPLRTIFRVSYGPEIKALDGRDVKLMGFIYPLEGGLEHEHFLLTAWPPSCPFCLPAGPSQLVDVHAREPIEFTDVRS